MCRELQPGLLQFWLALLTFLYVDFLDTTGTLFSMANFLNNFIPGAHHAQNRRVGRLWSALKLWTTDKCCCSADRCMRTSLIDDRSYDRRRLMQLLVPSFWR